MIDPQAPPRVGDRVVCIRAVEDAVSLGEQGTVLGCKQNDFGIWEFDFLWDSGKTTWSEVAVWNQWVEKAASNVSPHTPVQNRMIDFASSPVVSPMMQSQPPLPPPGFPPSDFNGPVHLQREDALAVFSGPPVYGIPRQDIRPLVQWQQSNPAAPEPEVSKQTRWTHGEIFFQETNSVCKYLAVPPHVRNAEEVLGVIFKHWHLDFPSMVISIQSGTSNYHRCYEPLVDVLKSQPRNWGNEIGEDSQEKYSKTCAGLMTGVCDVAADCGAWLVSSGSCSRHGDKHSGAVAIDGIVGFKENNQIRRHRIVNIGFKGDTDNELEQSIAAESVGQKLYQDVKQSGRLCYNLFYPFPVPVDLHMTGALLDERVHARIVYPEADWKQPYGNTVLGSVMLNTGLTHLIVGPKVVEDALALLESLVPNLHTIVAGKDRGALDLAYEKAQRGLVVIMINTGIWTNVLAKEVARRMKDKWDARRRPAHFLDAPPLVPQEFDKVGEEMPPSIPPENFLMFDALRTTSNLVVERLGKVVASSLEDDEYGCPRSEEQRIARALRLYATLRYNAEKFYGWSVVLFSCMVATMLGTVLCAVLAVASDLGSRESTVSNAGTTSYWAPVSTGGFEGSVELDALLAFACFSLPLVWLLLYSLSSQFVPDQKYALASAVSTRLLGEVYRYRTRSGIYGPKVRNNKLKNLVDHVRLHGPNVHCDQLDQEVNALHDGRAVFNRSRFVRQVNHIYQAALSCGMHTNNMTDPPEYFLRQLSDQVLHPDGMNNKDIWKPDQELSRPITPGPGKVAPDNFDMIAPEQTGQYLGKPSKNVDNIPASQNSMNMFSVTSLSEKGPSPSFGLAIDRADDGKSTVDADDYMVFRVVPGLKSLKLRRSILQTVWFCCRSLQVAIALLAVVLGFLGLRLYIPVAVAAFTVIELVNNFFKVQPRLSAMNMAAAELQQVIIWWGGLSLQDRRKANSKSRLVDVSENALELEIGAYCAAFPKRHEHIDMDDVDEERLPGHK